MSTHGQFNTKSPTIKRILREAAELSNTPSPDYHAAPLDTNLFEWHFTLRGPPAPSPFADGLYHGRIVLPPTYPLRPPSFRFLTPSGRFEPNREICLSISGHHEESWQPAWGIRTALVAIRSFMDSEAKGQLGGIESGERVRKSMAKESGEWRCSGCGGRSNREIIREREEEAAKADADGERVEEKVPEELKLGYRDELGKGKEVGGGGADAPATGDAATSTLPTQETTKHEQSLTSLVSVSDESAIVAPAAQVPNPTRTTQLQTPVQAPQGRAQQQQEQSPISWIDLAIIGIAVALGVMIIRKVLSLTS